MDFIENDWLTNQIVLFDQSEKPDDIPNVNPQNLNQKLKIVFDLVNNNKNESKQWKLIVNGTAGKGKSLTIYALSKLLKKSVKRCATTATTFKSSFFSNYSPSRYNSKSAI